MLGTLLVVSSLIIGQTDGHHRSASLLPPEIPATQPETNAPDAYAGYRIYDDGRPGIVGRFFRSYIDEFRPKDDNGNNENPPRRAMPSPFEAPPFPTAEYQGFPVIGLPVDTTKWALQKA